MYVGPPGEPDDAAVLEAVKPHKLGPHLCRINLVEGISRPQYVIKVHFQKVRYGTSPGAVALNAGYSRKGF